jgi:CBS domain-containing protein
VICDGSIMTRIEAYQFAGGQHGIGLIGVRTETAMRQVSDIVKDQKPLVMSPRATARHACENMRRVGAVLVTDRDDRLVGIFTGRNPLSMSPTSLAIDALRLMHDGGFRYVPVVARSKLVGIISHGDFRRLETDRLDAETGIWERI